MVAVISKGVALGGFVFGCGYGIWKRQWLLLALMIFFVPYFLLHAVYPYPIQRFHATIFWIALLVCLFGLQGAWALVDGSRRVPRGIVIALQVVMVAGAIGCLAWLMGLLPPLAQVSPKSATLPWAAMGVAALVFGARVFVYRSRALPRELSILAVMCVAIASNQFTVAPLLGDGLRESEFRDLAKWYLTNAKPGEKMGAYMAPTVRLFAPSASDSIVRLPTANSPAEFVQACYEQDITYVVWATREGMSTEHTGYRLMNLHTNIGHLGNPRDVRPPYQFVGQVGRRQGYVNIYRLVRPPDKMNE
jgi:hypothetical protein